MSSDKNGDATNGAGGGDKDSSAAKESSSKSSDSKSSEQLNLRVIGQDGEVIQFKIKSNTPFRKLMSVYCDRLKLVQNNIRYSWGVGRSLTSTKALLKKMLIEVSLYVMRSVALDK